MAPDYSPFLLTSYFSVGKISQFRGERKGSFQWWLWYEQKEDLQNQRASVLQYNVHEYYYVQFLR